MLDFFHLLRFTADLKISGETTWEKPENFKYPDVSFLIETQLPVDYVTDIDDVD